MCDMNWQIKLIIFIIIRLTLINSNITKTVEINLNKTTILGTLNTSWADDEFYAFRGIPYAKAPIGVRRFKDPEPLDKLPDQLDARYDGYECPSIFAKNASEDCLTLNVYTKSLHPTTLLPVIVFLHPGGLYLASSVSTFLGPEYLLSKQLVLVTCNYRLGTLGYLNLGTPDVPGNAGFKDQVLALRWVQSYIAHFGGDAADVTLMGYSAGALSVSLHLVSPLSQGLFHKAIIMSGSVPPQTLLPVGEQRYLAIRQAQALNCSLRNGYTNNDLMNCLARYSGNEIASTLRRLFDFGKDNPIYLWLPVVERDFGQQRFLVEDYYDSVKQGRFQKVPILSGYTSGELCTSAAELIENKLLEASFYENFQKLANTIFMYEGRSNTSQTSDALRTHYLKQSAAGSSDFDRLCDLFSDALIRFGIKRLLQLAAKYTNVYSYEFAYRGRYSNLQYQTKNARVEHMDDLMYLFSMEPHRFKAEDPESDIVKLYIDFIYDFVKQRNFAANRTLTFPAYKARITTKVEFQTYEPGEDEKLWQQMFP